MEYKVGDRVKIKPCDEMFDHITDDECSIIFGEHESQTIEKEGSEVDKFKAITDDMIHTFIVKNHDYGNSFENACDEEGIVAARIPIRNKWERFKTLSKGDKAMVEGESMRDTLKDMANYCILTMMWLDKNSNNRHHE